MWILTKLTTGENVYFISENKSYTVGRKNCDITFQDDASVSRKHCTFHIEKVNEGSVWSPTKICVVDEQSKYGTFLKQDNAWLQLNAHEREDLTSGSIIKIGLLENNWRLEYKPIVACTSGVPVEQKKTLETVLNSIDSYLRNSWCKECCVVIANEIILTVKVVLALINGIPIVTPAYIEKVAEAIKNQTEIPSYKNYQPVIKESILDKSLVSLDIKNHRRELFKGKRFIIPTEKQLETLREVIVCAGGTVELFSSTQAWESFADDDVVVIQLPSNASGIPKDLVKSFKEIDSFLKKKYGKRIVPESEIAQAVAYSSVEKFCNPQSTCFNVRVGEKKQLDLGPSLVEETPAASEYISQSQHGMVPASATYASETPLHPSSEKTEESQRDTDLTPKVQRESQRKFSQRKRTHSSDPVDEETPNKRSRNPNNESSRLGKESSADDKVTHDKPVESKGSESTTKTTEGDSSDVSEEIQVSRQGSGEFWEGEANSKRKASSESQNSDEEHSRKKARIEEPPETVTSKERVEVVRKSFPLPQKVAEENVFTDYFGKDNSVVDTIIHDLNNTILSLAIIPQSFLKEDGSLIDPPHIPVNVKRFRKQKILSMQIVEDDELSDGEWIEPHSDRLNISMLEGDDC